MFNPAATSFGTIFTNEVLLNSRRVAPYVLMVLFAVHAVFWWGWGAAVRQGWATNSDFNIHRDLVGFSFILGLPIFNAIIMGDPVIRDFRLGVDPLLFSKPVGRASYICAKFLGSFFVLVCCQSMFTLTKFVLQFFSLPKMTTLPFRVTPYFKHFLVVVVISHLVLGAIYFTAGTLTRSPKVVYGLAALFYPGYIAVHKIVLQSLPTFWTILLDPMGLFTGPKGYDPWHSSADFINQLVIKYNPPEIANRSLMIVISGLCLLVVYFRFSIAERAVKTEPFSLLNLCASSDRLYFDTYADLDYASLEHARHTPREIVSGVVLPKVTKLTEGFGAHLKQLIASLAVEFRLLASEKSLIVLAPLAVGISVLELAFYRVAPEVSYSETYAGKTAGALLLFMIGIAVFYGGEAMHRDREVRIAPMLWAAPAPSYVLLLSKFFATLLLILALISITGVVAFAIQLIRGHDPIEITAYLLTYGVVLLPAAVLLASFSVALNVLLRDKYVAYAVSVGTAGGLFYLYSSGYNHWLYNPLLYQLWTYSDLTSGGMLLRRLYWLAMAAICLALSHVFFARK